MDIAVKFSPALGNAYPPADCVRASCRPVRAGLFFGAVRTFSAAAGRRSDRCWPPLPPSRHAHVQFSSTTTAAATHPVRVYARTSASWFPSRFRSDGGANCLASKRATRLSGPPLPPPSSWPREEPVPTSPKRHLGASVFRTCISMGPTF